MDSKDMSHMAELAAHTTAAMLQQLGLAGQGGLATAVAEPATAAINAVNKVSVQVPPFWSKDPDLWFAKVEAQFATANVTASSTKFNHILKSLDQDTVREIREVVRNPRRGHEYEDIKAELLEIFGQSQASKDAELFGLSGLGDRKPTSVLRHIRGLATDKEMLIRAFFLVQLPADIRKILAVQEFHSVEAMAKAADKSTRTAPPSKSLLCPTSPRTTPQQKVTQSQ
ncbi:Uncharacterized protein FKW44_007914 [Caligus rogercresseyi]|uniref:DUF7041 domain-containing protein n=1 Tax=Caligus rogercresseyi TaxID=217165 RepID=A0A7T8QTX6_CALRO|nr:Uncharacterized protein FKW44_007914 [Caligus rogercresseyi]